MGAPAPLEPSEKAAPPEASSVPAFGAPCKARPVPLSSAAMTSGFKDHFSDASAAYRRYRPTYPEALFTWLAGQAPGHAHAWDCGTGSGQAALALAAHFDRVTATDASAEQIDQAPPGTAIEFRVVPAEHSGLETESVDLVTVAQALHWFDLPAFFAEARRVLRPGGAIAAWTYRLARVGPEVDAVLQDFTERTVGDYWPPERSLVEGGYAAIEFPFEPIEAPPFEMTADWDLATLAGYLRTWSSTKRFTAAQGHDPVGAVEARLARGWPEGERRRVRWPLAMRVGRR